jgi:hypothetical protein
MKRRNKDTPAFSLFSFQDIITSVTGVIMLVTLLLALKLTTQVSAKPSSNGIENVEMMQKRIAQTKESIAVLRLSLEGHSTLDEELGKHTSQSAAKELAVVTEEVRLLQNKVAELRQQSVDLDNLVEAANQDWLNQSDDVETLEKAQEELAAAQRELTELKNSQRVFYNQADEGGRQVYIVELFNSDILVAAAGLKSAPDRFSGPKKLADFVDWTKEISPSRVRFVIIVHPGTTDLFRKIEDELKGKGFKIGYDLLPKDKTAVDPKFGAG